jgi:hypothetical protein
MTTARLVIEALTPIAHFDTRTGIDNATNIRLTMTQPILLNGRRTYAPHVSENALRSVLLRIPLANHLLATLGIAGGVPRAALNLLYAGGGMSGGSRAPGDETVLGHAVGRLYPSLALLGGAVNAFILPRSKLRFSAWLVAQEYRDAIEAIFPAEADLAGTISAFDLIGDETRTRGTGDQAVGNQMLYGYQVLAAGTRIAIELTLDRWTSAATRAAIRRALTEWDGFIGGQGRQGRGRCRIVCVDGLDPSDEYDAHIIEHGEIMRAGILDGTLGTGKQICLG